MTGYRDGAQHFQLTMDRAVHFSSASQLIVGGFQEAAGIVSSYPDNTWMSPFMGTMDNIRLYGTTLSASDVQTLFNNKQ